MRSPIGSKVPGSEIATCLVAAGLHDMVRRASHSLVLCASRDFFDRRSRTVNVIINGENMIIKIFVKVPAS